MKNTNDIRRRLVALPTHGLALGLLLALSSLCGADEIRWSPVEVTTLGAQEWTVERARYGEVEIEGWRHVTRRSPDGSVWSRRLAPKRATFSASPNGPAERWDIVSRHLGNAEWSVALGPVPMRYLEVGDQHYRPAGLHRVRIGAGLVPLDERELAIDLINGTILRDRSILRHADAAGFVHGRVPTDGFPYSASATFEDLPLIGARVFSPFFGELFTDEDGYFVYDLPAGSSTFVTVDLAGPVFTVFNQASTTSNFFGLLGTTGPPAEIIFNEVPSEYTTAEAASFEAISRSYHWLLGLAPDFDPLEVPVTVNVNFAGDCFAFYSPILASLNFAQEGGGCPNTAYGSLVSHEYYHHLQDQIGLPLTPPYAEAMADVFAAYSLGNPRIGPEYFGPDTQLRNLGQIYQIPVSSVDPAEIGLPLSSAFWNLRLTLQSALGEEEGAQVAGELWLGSQLLTDGTLSTSVVEDLLFVDDDDGDLSNGTPNLAIIVDVFLQHGFPPPPLPITGLTCEPLENQVALTWDAPFASYDAIEIVRNGTPIAALPGDAIEYTDLFPPPGSQLYTVVGTINSATTPPALCVAEIGPYSAFVRGDTNLDFVLEISDAIELLSILFVPEVDSNGCDDTVDVDDNGTLEVTDAIVLLNFLFLSGPPPAAPYPDPGFDPTPDDMICQ
ncbi:MAG: hypothetical protein AAF488_00770 [Planctomycetota bacterium]